MPWFGTLAGRLGLGRVGDGRDGSLVGDGRRGGLVLVVGLQLACKVVIGMMLLSVILL